MGGFRLRTGVRFESGRFEPGRQDRGPLVVLAILLAALVLAPAAPAHADPTPPPGLTAVALASGPVHSVGHVVKVDFSLSAPALSVRFVYVDASTVTTQTLEWDSASPEGGVTGTAEGIVGDGYYTGTHSLQSVEIVHPSGLIHYGRDGKVTRREPWSYLSPPPAPDLTQLDFIVDGSAPGFRTTTMLEPPSIIGAPEEGFTLRLDEGRWAEPGGQVFALMEGWSWWPGESWYMHLVHWHIGHAVKVDTRWAKPGFYPVTVTTEPVGPVRSPYPRLLGQGSVGSILRPDFDLARVESPDGVAPTAAYRWATIGESSVTQRGTGSSYRLSPADASSWGLTVTLDVQIGTRLLEGRHVDRRGPWADSHSTSGFNDDGNPDLLARDAAGNLLMYPTGGNGTWGGPQRIGHGWTHLTALLKVGDFDGDHHNDVVARDGAGRLLLYPGNGRGGWLPPRQIGQGWNSLDMLTAAGDFSGDGNNDILGRNQAGQLVMYPGTGDGGFYPPEVVGAGWDAVDRIFSPGDFDGDGYNDILARDHGGILHFYGGNGGAGWTLTRPVGYGWHSLTGFGAAGDFNGDGRPDVWATDSGGQLRMYYGNGPGADGTGPWKGAAVVGWGWGGFDAVF